MAYKKYIDKPMFILINDVMKMKSKCVYVKK